MFEATQGFNHAHLITGDGDQSCFQRVAKRRLRSNNFGPSFMGHGDGVVGAVSIGRHRYASSDPHASGAIADGERDVGINTGRKLRHDSGLECVDESCRVTSQYLSSADPETAVASKVHLAF